MTSGFDVATSVSKVMPEVVEELKQLVRIPSIARSDVPHVPIETAMRTVEALLREAGLQNVRSLPDCSKDYPPVFGEMKGPVGSPTVLLYSHYDVVPPGKTEEWDTAPFTPTIREGRLYGRGAADDKSGIAAHLGTIKAFAGNPPVSIKIIIEGDEETGGSLVDYIATHSDLFKADVFIICDHGPIKVGQPSVTASLRGVASFTLEVKTLKAPVHNGVFGGAVPDALLALNHIIASFHDTNGNIQVPGLRGGDGTGIVIPPETLRAAAGVLEGVDLIENRPFSEELWQSCSINVIGMDIPSIASASNSLIDKASARVNLRIPPNLDPDYAINCLVKDIQKITPWHAEVRVSDFQSLKGFQARTEGQAYSLALRALQEVYNAEPQIIGDGASVPLTNVLSKKFPQAEIIIWGAEDMAAGIHGPNESVDLAELERVINTQVVFLQKLADKSG